MWRRFDCASFLFGAVVGALGTRAAKPFMGRKQASRAPRQVRTGAAIEISLMKAGEPSALFEPLIASYTPIRDRRTFGSNHAAPAREIALFRERRQHRLGTIDRPGVPPPPGGLGAGVTFGQSLLQFTKETGVYFYNLAPVSIGPQPNAQLIYMTSSNTASKGCEALLSFFSDQQFDCAFRIWDWAHPDMPDGGKFVKNYGYAELTDYLIPYRLPLDSGGELDTVCVYIANITRQLPTGTYQNEVYLHNHVTGTRDQMWSFSFDWPTKATDQSFWWGPIFETFPDPGAQYALGSPLGFDQTVIVQDGSQYQLTNQDSTMTPPVGNGLLEVYRSQDSNSGLVCSASRTISNFPYRVQRVHLQRPASFTKY